MSEPGDGMLEVDRVSIRLGGRDILRQLSFSVPPGRVVGLLGPNGAGKTTAMRAMFGVMDPDAGTIRWRGRPATAADRSRWGYMPQERGLYQKMRAHEQVVYFARLRGLRAEQARSRACELLAAVGLEAPHDTKVERLSGGMQQRLQLATALVHEPEVLVLDEPFAGLDPIGVNHLSGVIAEQAATGRTVVFSSHQLDLVEDLCETIVLIDRGRVVLAGDLRALKEASGHRVLRLGLRGAPPELSGDLPGTTVLRAVGQEVVLRLDPGTDPLGILDRARAVARVEGFALELPRLSQLFLEAVRR